MISQIILKGAIVGFGVPADGDGMKMAQKRRTGSNGFGG